LENALNETTVFFGGSNNETTRRRRKSCNGWFLRKIRYKSVAVQRKGAWGFTKNERRDADSGLLFFCQTGFTPTLYITVICNV
jgi:hypothetical protein